MVLLPSNNPKIAKRDFPKRPAYLHKLLIYLSLVRGSSSQILPLTTSAPSHRCSNKALKVHSHSLKSLFWLTSLCRASNIPKHTPLICIILMTCSKILSQPSLKWWRTRNPNWMKTLILSLAATAKRDWMIQGNNCYQITPPQNTKNKSKIQAFWETKISLFYLVFLLFHIQKH